MRSCAVWRCCGNSRAAPPEVYCRPEGKAVATPADEVESVARKPIKFHAPDRRETRGVEYGNSTRIYIVRILAQEEDAIDAGVRCAGASVGESSHQSRRHGGNRGWIQYTAAVREIILVSRIPNVEPEVIDKRAYTYRSSSRNCRARTNVWHKRTPSRILGGMMMSPLHVDLLLRLT